MPQESIGSIDTGDMPNDELIMLCLNLTKRHIEFVYGQVPVVRLESFGMIGYWRSILQCVSGMKGSI
jgi:hypothetical protein